MLVNFCQCGKTKARIQARQLAHFDFVHVVIATKQQQPNLGGFELALLVCFVGGQDQRFHSAGQRDVQQSRHILAGALAGRGCECLGLRCSRSLSGGRQSFCLFHVGRVIALRAIHDGVLAGGRNDLKLFTQIATNSATVGCYSTVAQAKAVKDFAIGIGHDFVTLFG